MRHLFTSECCGLLLLLSSAGQAQVAPKAVDVPTRPGVTQRFLYLAPEHPTATVILFAGGQGGLQIDPDGKLSQCPKAIATPPAIIPP